MDDSEDLRDQDAVVQVFFYPGWQADRQRSFFLRVARGDTKAQVFVKLSETVLCGDAIYSGGNHDANRDRRWGNY